VVAVAQASERLGFETFFRSDHHLAPTTTSPWAVLAMGGAGLPGPTSAWVTLGALARETSRIRLGTLLSLATVLGRRDGRRDAGEANSAQSASRSASWRALVWA